MALEQIFARILDDANLEARDIIDAALEEANIIIQQAEKEATALKQRMVDEGRQELESISRKEIVTKRLIAQKDILQVKKSQLDSCFQAALDALMNLNDSLYCNLINNMLAKIDLKDEAEIIFSTHDRPRINQGDIRKANPNLKLSFTDDIQGGFILKTKDLIIDSCLANILNNLRWNFEPKVAEILFKES